MSDSEDIGALPPSNFANFQVFRKNEYFDVFVQHQARDRSADHLTTDESSGVLVKGHVQKFQVELVPLHQDWLIEEVECTLTLLRDEDKTAVRGMLYGTGPKTSKSKPSVEEMNACAVHTVTEKALGARVSLTRVVMLETSGWTQNKNGNFLFKLETKARCAYKDPCTGALLHRVDGVRCDLMSIPFLVCARATDAREKKEQPRARSRSRSTSNSSRTANAATPKSSPKPPSPSPPPPSLVFSPSASSNIITHMGPPPPYFKPSPTAGGGGGGYSDPRVESGFYGAMESSAMAHVTFAGFGMTGGASQQYLGVEQDHAPLKRQPSPQISLREYTKVQRHNEDLQYQIEELKRQMAAKDAKIQQYEFERGGYYHSEEAGQQQHWEEEEEEKVVVLQQECGSSTLHFEMPTRNSCGIDEYFSTDGAMALLKNPHEDMFIHSTSPLTAEVGGQNYVNGSGDPIGLGNLKISNNNNNTASGGGGGDDHQTPHDFHPAPTSPNLFWSTPFSPTAPPIIATSQDFDDIAYATDPFFRHS